MEARYCKHPRHEGGEKIPTSCQGKNMTISISGGHCVFNKDKTGGVLPSQLTRGWAALVRASVP